MQIRLKAKPDDMTRAVEKCLDWLDAECFPGDKLHDKDDRFWWIVYDGQLPVAFAGLRMLGNDAWLSRCGVIKSHRGKGLQRRLIKARLSYAKRLKANCCRVYTMHHNAPSSNNLIKCGFVMENRQDDADILYWIKVFSGTPRDSTTLERRLSE